jgi:hypothetical protein
MNKICLFFLLNQIRKQKTHDLEETINKNKFDKCMNQLKQFNIKNKYKETIYFSKYSILSSNY